MLSFARADWWPAVTRPSTHVGAVEDLAGLRDLLGRQHVGNAEKHQAFSWSAIR